MCVGTVRVTFCKCTNPYCEKERNYYRHDHHASAADIDWEYCEFSTGYSPSSGKRIPCRNAPLQPDTGHHAWDPKNLCEFCRNRDCKRRSKKNFTHFILRPDNIKLTGTKSQVRSQFRMWLEDQGLMHGWLSQDQLNTPRLG